MRNKIREIEKAALREIETAGGNKDSLEAIRVKYLGRKGIVTGLFKEMALLTAEERPEAGNLVNSLKDIVAKALDEKASTVAIDGEEEKEKIDVTLPGAEARLGKAHPVTRALNDIADIFGSMAFISVEGPEIETERYNFEALNIPLEHPSRDAFDTFYLESAGSTGKRLLRSHTSPVQARFMERNKPPFSIIVPGKVFTFRDAYEGFTEAGVEVVGVSADSQESHRKFRDTYLLPFSLLSDEKGEVKKLYGLSGHLLPDRVTFVIDKEGVVLSVFSSKIDMKAHVDEAMKIIKSLN